jgi:hypothetical protein
MARRSASQSLPAAVLPFATAAHLGLPLTTVDAKKSLRLLSEHGQRADHPVLVTLPETGYLKGFSVEIVATR